MRFSSLGFCGKTSRCAAVTAVAIFLAGCSEDPGLQERLNRLQAEMQEKDRQLQEARSTLEKTKSELKTARAARPAAADSPAATPEAKPSFLPREQVEENYGSASKAMQKRLASELRDYSVENCAQFPVTMPSDAYPYRSKVALTFRADNGHSYRLEFPVNADAAGKWTFPDPVDIATALADSRHQDQATAINTTPTAASSPRVTQTSGTPSPGNRAATPSNSQLVPGQSATETRVIDWGGARPTNNSRSAPSPSANSSAAPSPQQSRTPAQSMPSDRDVKIHW